MPRRPPASPLPRGLLWTLLPRGAHARGAPNFEWRYRSPAFPDGISPLLVTNLTREEQDSLAEYWFRLNFVPIEVEVGAGGYGVSSARPIGYAPGHMLPGAYLTDEFGNVLPPTVIDEVSVRLQRESIWWIPAPPDVAGIQGDDPAAAARAALDRVETDLARVGPGHNQGPPLDPAIIAEIRDAVKLGIQAVSPGGAGRDAGRSAATGLITLAGSIGSAFVQGVAKKAGEDAEPAIKHGLAILLDHMLQAASALLHWIASIPPGPLL